LGAKLDWWRCSIGLFLGGCVQSNLAILPQGFIPIC
jgi:hypothetical protein